MDDLKQFYKTYIRYELEDKKAEAISLKRRVLSPACFEKLARVTAITNSNPLLRAQDVNPDMLESIHVEEIGNDWFVVSYYWDMTRRF